ncbi:hypothetical protein M0802_009358 [Mischocyttarus mexicanus]|nr:hypothetical protein M0802_009358 [Mischocyttarus mexicanus]
MVVWFNSVQFSSVKFRLALFEEADCDEPAELNSMQSSFTYEVLNRNYCSNRIDLEESQRRNSHVPLRSKVTQHEIPYYSRRNSHSLRLPQHRIETATTATPATTFRLDPLTSSHYYRRFIPSTQFSRQKMCGYANDQGSLEGSNMEPN